MRKHYEINRVRCCWSSIEWDLFFGEIVSDNESVVRFGLMSNEAKDNIDTDHGCLHFVHANVQNLVVN